MNANPTQKKSLTLAMAERFGVEPDHLINSLKTTVFKGRNGETPTDAQMVALLLVSQQYNLNPFTKEIYAFPTKDGGIVPIVGVDGWNRIINEHPEMDGIEFNESPDWVTPEGGKPCPTWIECIIYRKDRTHPTKVKEYLDETYKPPVTKKGQYGEYTIDSPWQTHTKRFLRHKAEIQCSRIAFGYTGIYDQDEAERIVEREINPVSQQQAPALEQAPQKQPKISIKETKAELLDDVDVKLQEPVEELVKAVDEAEVSEESLVLIRNVICRAEAKGNWEEAEAYLTTKLQPVELQFARQQIDVAKKAA